MDWHNPSDWHNDTGVIRQAEEQQMGVILMRPLTSGVFQRLMAEAFPEIDAVSRAACCSITCSRIRTWTWRWWACASRGLSTSITRSRTMLRRALIWRHSTIGM